MAHTLKEVAVRAAMALLLVLVSLGMASAQGEPPTEQKPGDRTSLKHIDGGQVSFENSIVLRPLITPTGTQPVYLSWIDDSGEGRGTNIGLNVYVDEKSSKGSAAFLGILGRAAFDAAVSPSKPYIGVEGQAVRGASGIGGATKTPEMWGMIADSVDFTGVQSSKTNAQLAMEADVEANDVDDANQRQGIVILLVQRDPKGSAAQADYGLHITQSALVGVRDYSAFKRSLAIEGNYDIAAIDLRRATKDGFGSGLVPHVLAPGASGEVVPISNIFPFVDDAVGQNLDLSPGRAATVYINGHPYTETHYTILGKGPEGTITVMPQVKLDGTPGNIVEANSHALWLSSREDIAFDDVGRGNQPIVSIFGDGARLNVTGGLALKGDETVSGTLKFATYAYVDLPPAGAAGREVFCMDCRKPSEAAGAGTGMMVFDDGHNRWISTAGGTVASH